MILAHPAEAKANTAIPVSHRVSGVRKGLDLSLSRSSCSAW
jgi:hypothetical protein